MYLEAADTSLLLKWLDEDGEIAFLVGDGPGRWKAVEKLSQPVDGTHSLWHIPGPPLPLLGPKATDLGGFVQDPWKGWTERRAGADPGRPYFGAGHISNPHLNIRVRYVSPNPDRGGRDVLGMSSFEWIGNHYRAIGAATSSSTEAWWKRLRKWISKRAVKVARDGAWDGANPEIWAFPAAIEAIRAGLPRARNPF
jgi:hypothetical protein